MNVITVIPEQAQFSILNDGTIAFCVRVAEEGDKLSCWYTTQEFAAQFVKLIIGI